MARLFSQAVTSNASGRSGNILWTCLALLSLIIGYSFLTRQHELPALLVAAFVFVVVLVLCPSCRPDTQTWITPKNFALLIFVFMMVVIPFLVVLTGAVKYVLPYLPSDFDMNKAILLDTLAFISFCVGYEYWDRRQRGRLSGRPWPLLHSSYTRLWYPGRILILVFVVTGVIALIWRFGSIQKFIEYLANPTERLFAAGRSATLSEGLGQLMQPFASYAIVIVWCKWLDTKGQRIHWIVAGVVSAGFLIVTVLASANYNRGTLFTPILSYLAVFSLRKHKLSPVVMILFLLPLMILAIIYGTYRAGNITFSDIVSSKTVQTEMLAKTEFLTFSQVYLGGPQFLAFFMENTDYGSKLYWGRTLLGSVFTPVPVLGRPFRTFSGPLVYNEAIYGHGSEIFDQVIPFVGELMVNFHVVGIIIGYLLIGILVRVYQRKFMRTKQDSAIMSYCWFPICLWTVQLVGGSLSVVSQLYIYAFCPIYVLFILRRISAAKQRKTAARAGASVLAQL